MEKPEIFYNNKLQIVRICLVVTWTTTKTHKQRRSKQSVNLLLDQWLDLQVASTKQIYKL